MAYAAAGWGDIVELAIEQRVAVVCLSGDVADQDNRFFEAIGPLERGIGRLAERGIRTVAVAGNHDHDVLGRLADQFPPEAFKLLGRGGVWERLSIEHDGTVLHIDGWSFPQRYVTQNPLHDYPIREGGGDGAAVLGMVHGDLDNPASPYGPLELARLQGLPVAGWLLGHIHAPRLIAPEGRPFVLYPGSPQALDPGETGHHGPWLAEVGAGRIHTPVQRPRSPIIYEQAAIDLTDLTHEHEAEQAIYSTVRRRAEQVAGENEKAQCLVLRLSLTGRTPLASRLSGLAGRVSSDLTSAASLRIVIDRIEDVTLPAIDLDEHATAGTAPGALARLIKALDARQPDGPTAAAESDLGEDEAALLREAREAIERVCQSPHFTTLGEMPLADADVRRMVHRQARQMLAALISQKQDE